VLTCKQSSTRIRGTTSSPDSRVKWLTVRVVLFRRCRSCMSWQESGNPYPTRFHTSRKDLRLFSSSMSKVPAALCFAVQFLYQDMCPSVSTTGLLFLGIFRLGQVLQKKTFRDDLACSLHTVCPSCHPSDSIKALKLRSASRFSSYVRTCPSVSTTGLLFQGYFRLGQVLRNQTFRDNLA